MWDTANSDQSAIGAFTYRGCKPFREWLRNDCEKLAVKCTYFLMPATCVWALIHVACQAAVPTGVSQSPHGFSVQTHLLTSFFTLSSHTSLAVTKRTTYVF